jgi:peptidoglycan/xylan/chitin deacetylase (PgdA/CDA1 family)
VLPCALTLDDAPAVEGIDLSQAAAIMDAVRQALQRQGIARCVAFVIGARARGHEGALERWLEAGYELGNHTDEHPWASKTDERSFIESVRSCDVLLARVGAFDEGRTRYFRYPFGDRGRDPETRTRIRRACAELGYTLADVSLNLHDYCYEAPLAQALRDNDAARATRIEARFAAQARDFLASAPRLLPQGEPHIAGVHFGRVSARSLDRLLAGVRGSVQWLGLEHAARASTYARFAQDPLHNGIVGEVLEARAALPLRELRRRSARLARKLDLFDQSRLGPLWPQWTG